MTLKGIDVSSWNGWPFNAPTEAAYKGSDFLIAKATQGTTYVNPYCDRAIQRAIKDGKLFGFYHYAGGGDPVAEANFFYENCKGYFKKGIPCLDWEAGDNAAWGDSAWCKKFVDRIHKLTGVWCMIYVQASAVNQCANCAKDCALWIAGYPDSRANWTIPTFNYSTGAWATYTLWQYTSGGGVDRNTANLNKAGWLKIAGASTSKTTSKATTTKATAKKAVKVGSKIKVKNGANIYGTTSKFASHVYKTVYKVVEIKGSRVVFATAKGVVIGAVNKNDCIAQ